MYNRFAKMRHRYLREHRNGIYTGMFLDGKLEDHLKEIGEAAEEMFDRLVEQMKKAEGVTEKLKAENQMEWVGRMKDKITSKITRHIGVISESSRGWKLELNMVSWNGAEPKLDIHDWSPDHDRCTSRGTFTKDEARTLIRLLKKEV